MKRIKLVLYFFITCISGYSQGLEDIIVEKYYISDGKDTTVLFGKSLPVGSVTYRIYVDMLPGYKFQAVFGLPDHELRIETSTLFFNNEDKGGVVPNMIPERNLGKNTVMLDSWISAGAAAENNFGLLKTEDDTTGTIKNKHGILQGENKKAGIPIKLVDGLMPGDPSKVTGFGIDSIVKVFDNTTNGSLFLTTNGSWAAMQGATGPTPANRVLVAQLTTDGKLSFKLNIQIGTPGGAVEQYVAENPSGSEIQFPGLTYPPVKGKGSAGRKKKNRSE
jgi:hypothetical protein